jgi:hypothetical protein
MMVPILTFGPNNNFAKFKEALASKALHEYGDLGRLIDAGQYYSAEPPELTDYDLVNDPYGHHRATFLEQQKLYMRHWEDMINDHQKLYAMIWQHLSQESKEEVKRSQDYELIKNTRDAQGLWQIIEETHKVFMISRIAAVMKKSACKEYQLMHQGPYESIITYKERFDIALKAYEDQENAELLQPNIAMDFFDGLNNGRYADFKKSILNGMTARSVTQPATLNEMYLLANQWLKTTGTAQSGLASTFVTKLDMPNQSQKAGRKDGKEKGKGKQTSEAMEKPKHDMSKVKCFYSNEFGHIAPNCPKKLLENQNASKNDDDLKAFASWDDEEVEEEEQAGTYLTYQVCHGVESGQKFQDYDLLLDNQANISVIHPRLLRELIPADVPITVNGIGGKQLTVTHTGYLDEFFRVYCSEAAKPNVLSMADVEDMSPITYVPGKAFVVHLPSRDLEFKHKGKLYVANYYLVLNLSSIYATVQENEEVYTQAEVQKAKAAFEFLKCSRYPSPDEAMHLLSDGNIFGLPELT